MQVAAKRWLPDGRVRLHPQSMDATDNVVIQAIGGIRFLVFGDGYCPHHDSSIMAALSLWAQCFVVINRRRTHDMFLPLGGRQLLR